MLLERLVGKSSEEPEYNWAGYYEWLYGELTGREGAELQFWICRKCLTVNVVTQPVRYGKCRECNLIHMGHQLGPPKRR